MDRIVTQLSERILQIMLINNRIGVQLFTCGVVNEST